MSGGFVKDTTLSSRFSLCLRYEKTFYQQCLVENTVSLGRALRCHPHSWDRVRLSYTGPGLGGGLQIPGKGLSQGEAWQGRLWQGKPDSERMKLGETGGNLVPTTARVQPALSPVHHLSGDPRSPEYRLVAVLGLEEGAWRDWGQ